MGAHRTRGGARPVGEFAASVLDPVLRRRAGISIGLLQSWEEIAGDRLAHTTRPEKIDWPRRISDDDPFRPATLTVACEGPAALLLQHETAELVARINVFLGFAAIGRIRIVQKPVAAPAAASKRKKRMPSDVEISRVGSLVAEISDESLRDALDRLGRNVMSHNR